jgi:uncharacterized protein (TIGR02145 family)
MKKVYTILLVAVCIAINVFSQVPEKMTYQAVVRNTSDELVKNTNVGMQISVLQGSATGTAVYVETQTPTTNVNGLVTLEIGDGTAISGTFASIDWSTGVYYIKTETDPAGGTNYTITGTSQILSVPYALYANKAGDGFNGNYNDLENKPDFVGWDDNAADDFSGSYSDLTDKPTLFSGNYNDLTNKPVLFDGLWNSLTGKPTFSTVATSGSYNDLLNKPTIPLINDASTSTSSLWSSTKTNTELGNKANITDVYTKTNLQTTGQAIVHYYNLSNKPTNIDEDKTDDVTLSGNQTISGNKTFSGTITVATPVNATDAATKEYVDALKVMILDLQAECGVTDKDGNHYNAVRIGNQLWMVENLKTTKYSDGTAIPNITDGTTWAATTSPAYCWYDNDASTYKDTYGGLYNRYAVMTGKLCPIGWHVPTNEDWTTLGTYLGGNAVAGGKLKEAGTAHWLSPNVGATNESGFTGLPTGYRYDGDGTFHNINVDKNHSDMWSSTLVSECCAYYRTLYSHLAELIVRTDGQWKSGLNVRCLKD